MLSLKITYEKKLYLLFIVTYFSLPPIKVLCQETGKTDTTWAIISKDLQPVIVGILNETIIDSSNFADIFVFKGKVDSKGRLSIQASQHTPLSLSNAVRSSLDSVIGKIRSEKHISLIAEKTFLFPLIVEYRGSPIKRTINNINVQRVLEMMQFDNSIGESTDESPINCVLLPVYFYQSPHTRSGPKDWLKKD